MNDTEDKCDRLIRSLNGEIVSFSVSERAQLPNLPDRRYRLRSTAFWWEVKGPKDKLSQGQLDFLTAEYRCGQIVGAGDAEALLALVTQRASDWRSLGYTALATVLARGIRKQAA